MKLWTISEIAKLTGFSDSKIRGDIGSKLLEVEKIGGSLRVRHSKLIAYLGFDPLDEPEVKVPAGLAKKKRKPRNTASVERGMKEV